MRSRASGAARLEGSSCCFSVCAIAAEALAHQLNEVSAFLGRAMSDRAGARPYQSQRHRLIKSANPRLFAEMQSTRPRSGSNPRVLCLTTDPRIVAFLQRFPNLRVLFAHARPIERPGGHLSMTRK